MAQHPSTNMQSLSCLCRCECHKTAVQSAHWSFHTGAVASCWPLQLNCLSRLNLFIPCVCASSTCLHQNFSWQTTSSSGLAVLTVTHVSTSIYWNIYMEHFRESGLRNMCATNAGGMIHIGQIQLFPAHGLLSWSIWSLRRLPKIISGHNVFQIVHVPHNI